MDMMNGARLRLSHLMVASPARVYIQVILRRIGHSMIFIPTANLYFRSLEIVGFEHVVLADMEREKL